MFCSYLSHFSTVSAVFGLVSTGKPATRAGWVDTGAGAGQAELPVGYPRQSLDGCGDGVGENFFVNSFLFVKKDLSCRSG